MSQDPQGKEPEQAKKVLAIVTGAISLALGIAYLMLVQFLDSRGPMMPAPLGTLDILGLLDIPATLKPLSTLATLTEILH